MRGRYLDVDLVLLVRIHRRGRCFAPSLENGKSPRKVVCFARWRLRLVLSFTSGWAGWAGSSVEWFGFFLVDLVTSQGEREFVPKRWGTCRAGRRENAFGGAVYKRWLLLVSCTARGFGVRVF